MDLKTPRKTSLPVAAQVTDLKRLLDLRGAYGGLQIHPTGLGNAELDELLWPMEGPVPADKK